MTERRRPLPPPPKRRRRPLPDVRELVRRERPFDPEVPPERYARPHHFAVNPSHLWVVYVNPSGVSGDEGLWAYRYEGDARARVLNWVELEEDDEIDVVDEDGNVEVQTVRDIATEDLGDALEKSGHGERIVVQLIEENWPPGGDWARVPPR